MYKNIELLNTNEHKNIAIKQVADVAYAQELTSSPITVPEFFEACKDYPIVFAKDANNNSWFATVLLGYKEKENIFINNETKFWEPNRYIPAFIRRYPFVSVAQSGAQDIAIAVEGEYKSEDEKDASRKLFNEDGSNTEFLNSVISFLNQYQNDAVATTAFINQLNDWELLEEKTATITTADNKIYNINGLFIVNEEKLKHLSKKKQEDICNKNASPLITAHLISLSNIARLGRRG